MSVETPKGAPRLGEDEIIAEAIRYYYHHHKFGSVPLQPVKQPQRDLAEELAEWICGAIASAGATIILPERFEPEPLHMTFTAYGVSLSPLGEDGDEIVALGHVPRRRLLAALNRYWRTYVGLTRQDIAELTSNGSTRHAWGEFIAHADASASDWAWLCYPASAFDPEPTPITRWSA
ncbi:hypothetical protein [Rhodococcoides fascians]|uniref:hypothetical protein n=1 Tax=Rhodococcoides fascians TaxID=1828 RepID=UPI000522FB6E|nr:hypothetical protein [Rhodococcus fascians]